MVADWIDKLYQLASTGALPVAYCALPMSCIIMFLIAVLGGKRR